MGHVGEPTNKIGISGVNLAVQLGLSMMILEAVIFHFFGHYYH